MQSAGKQAGVRRSGQIVNAGTKVPGKGEVQLPFPDLKVGAISLSSAKLLIFNSPGSLSA